MRISFLLLAIGLSTNVLAEPVIERYDDVAFNWGTMRWVFAGEATVAESHGNDAYKAAEKQAWQHGLRTIQNAVTQLQVKQLNSPKDRAIDLAREVTRSTYSRNTTYFSSGIVRVDLENSLVAARSPDEVEVGSTEGGKARNTSLLIELDRPIAPSAIYRVLNESGEVVFQSKNVSKEFYAKNLMGRWFKGQSGRVFSTYAGSSPIKVSATVRDGDFMVSQGEWDKALRENEALLSQAKVLVILPK